MQEDKYELIYFLESPCERGHKTEINKGKNTDHYRKLKISMNERGGRGPPCNFQTCTFMLAAFSLSFLTLRFFHEMKNISFPPGFIQEKSPRSGKVKTKKRRMLRHLKYFFFVEHTLGVKEALLAFVI